MSKHKIRKEKKIVFFPSISMDKKTWCWKRNIQIDGLLVSYDVLLSNKKIFSSSEELSKTLRFPGYIIIDSGAFGKVHETDPVVVYNHQLKCKPDIAILLDKIPPGNAAEKQVKECIDTTLKNARNISQLNTERLNLMAVIQGNDPKTQIDCSKKLFKMGYDIIGIPLSHLSKHRNYEKGIQKFLSIQKVFGPKAIYHGLGCGSRTLISLLSAFGMNFFDSSSYYKAAAFGEAVKPVSMCSIDKIHAKPECKKCLRKQRIPITYQARIHYNLREIHKEIQRCRCAKENNMFDSYLKARLSSNLYKKIIPYLNAQKKNE